MLEHQERELTPYEIADISYDLSVRDGILGLDKVKDSLRKIQPHRRSTHHIGVDYENWRLAINHMVDDLDDLIQKALESLKINAINTTVTDGSYELDPTRAGIHSVPSIPGYTWSHTSMYSPFVLRHTMVRTGGAT